MSSIDKEEMKMVGMIKPKITMAEEMFKKSIKEKVENGTDRFKKSLKEKLP